MSYYRNKLQEALLRNSPTRNSPTHNFYAVCEGAGVAVGLAAWAWAIICHMGAL